MIGWPSRYGSDMLAYSRYGSDRLACIAEDSQYINCVHHFFFTVVHSDCGSCSVH